MSAEIEMEDAGTQAPERFTEVPVKREGPLPRYAADTAVPVYLGRDFEIAVLSYTVRLDAEVAESGPEDQQAKSMRVSGELLELARLRMAPSGARELAMGIMRQLLDHGLLAGDTLKHEISEMIESVQSEHTGEQ